MRITSMTAGTLGAVAVAMGCAAAPASATVSHARPPVAQRWTTTGLTGVYADGGYAQARRGVQVWLRVQDTKRDGRGAAVQLTFADREYSRTVWCVNPGGYGSSHVCRFRSHLTSHLYYREALAVNGKADRLGAQYRVY